MFRYFQRHGVELCSGFGMTEGTGGITMTPPGEYEDGSVGVPLPGIEARLSPIGELEIAGPYVAHYLDDPAPLPGEVRWLPTGDIFVRRPSGHFEIVDRVKDVYKNTRGQTVAPAAVERRLADVPGVKRAFLVGDGRDHNALLIVPDRADPAIAGATPEGEEAYFSQLVAAVNRDVATPERVVRFALLDRDFDPERELTPKGTYRRKEIERAFATVVDSLYRSDAVEIALRPGPRATAALGLPGPRPPRGRHRGPSRRAPREALGPRARGGRGHGGGDGACRRPRVPGRRGGGGPGPLRPPADAVGREPAAARLRAVQGRLGRAARARLAAAAAAGGAGRVVASRARARHAGARRRRCAKRTRRAPGPSSGEALPRSRRSLSWRTS